MTTIHQPPVGTADCLPSAQDSPAPGPTNLPSAATGIIRVRLTRRDGAPLGFRVAWCLPPSRLRLKAWHTVRLTVRLPRKAPLTIRLLLTVRLTVWPRLTVRLTVRHLDYSALLHALVTADQALIGRLLAGPPAGETYPAYQQEDGPVQLPSHDPSEERAACSIVVDPPEPPGSDEAVDNQPGSAGSDEYLASCAAPSDFSVLSSELQQDILHSIEQIISHVDGVADEVMRSMVSEDNGFLALRIFYRNLDSSCELFRAYFSVLERVADEAAGNSIREELLEFLQIPAKYLRKRLKILRRLRGLSSSTEAPILQALIREITNVLEPAESVTGSQPEEADMLVSQPQLTYMKGIQPVSLSERRWVHADEVVMRRGRQWRPCYLVLLSDLVLIAQRNRQVVFVTEPPLMLTDVIQHTFNVKKKETEFQLTVPAAGGGHRKPRCLAFRAPNLEAKLAWEDQVHKQMSLMRASQSSGSLASQRSVSCDALIETYKVGQHNN
ncbi:uncharacterized protein LOC122363590 [Amphibalanus amphitrite]|uniref:uncharacterized protein LOC122363590 n=1 Tax=Amphibalanus amphitrite TaxID=1232801 RepID=UPI001C8FCD2D|nr:uncharacterized protein LOC122363590 [Amphibalanus amphitrite]